MKYVFIPILRSIHVVLMLMFLFILIIIISIVCLIWEFSLKRVKSLLEDSNEGRPFWEMDMNGRYAFDKNFDKIYANPIDYIIMKPITRLKSYNYPENPSND